MVSDGESGGIVAIVQGLQDAGLAVMVMDARLRRKKAGSNVAIERSYRIPKNRSSVETSTEGLMRSNTSSQICDGRYMSSYQLAHCCVKATSPSVHVPEFPPQRAAPNTSQGNFQVGGCGSRESSYTPVRASFSYRGSPTWPQRGSSLSPSRESDAFAHSLRRYPSASPRRTVSTELVQRLLTYTQAKHFTKNSHHSKSMRSLDPKIAITADKQTNTKSTKNIQTYTRAKQECAEKSANTNNEIKFTGRKNFKFNWRSMEKRNIKYKDNQLNVSYDYLKSTNESKRPAAGAARGRGTEVRYLSDVARCIRDTIRQIYEDKPLVCPNIRCRYSHHKRECHRQSADQHSSSHFNNIEVQASLPTALKEASIMTRCEAPMGSSHPSKTSVQICCYCKRPKPCACDTDPSILMSHLQRTSVKCSCKNPKDDLLAKIDAEIRSWLREVPVYAGETAENKTLREEMIKGLENKLMLLVKEADFKSIKEAIEKCLRSFPMWCPNTQNDKEIFTNHIADSLFNRLKVLAEKHRFRTKMSDWIDEIPFIDSQIVDKGRILDNFIDKLIPIESDEANYKENLKSEIIDILEEIPINIYGSKTKLINQMAEKLAIKLTHVSCEGQGATKARNEQTAMERNEENAMQNEISDWLDDIPEFSSGSASDSNENIKIIDILTKKILEIQSNRIENEEVQEKVSEEIESWLESTMNTKGVYFDSKTKKMLLMKLIDKLNLANIETKQKTRKPCLDGLSYVQQIQNWLEDTPQLTGNKVGSKLVENLADKLQDMQKDDDDDDVIQEEIVDWLDNLARTTGVDIEWRSKTNIAKELIKRLRPRKRTNENLKQCIMREISNLINDGPIKLSNNKRKNVKDKMSNIILKNIDNVLSNKSHSTKMEIVKLLEHEANMNKEDAKELARTSINCIKGMSLPIEIEKSVALESLRAEKDIKESIKGEVSDVLDNLNVDNREELETSLANILTDEIMRGEDPAKIRSDVYSILHDAHVAEDQAENISLKLVGRAQEMSLEYKSRDSSTTLNVKSRFQKGRSSDPMYRECFKDDAEKVILDYIGQICGDSSPQSKKKMKIGTSDLVEKLDKIMLDSDFNIQNVKKEISQFFRKISIQSEKPKDELINELVIRIQNIGFQASTPRKSSFSFRPQRDIFGLDNMSSIHVERISSQTINASRQPKSEEEQKYSKELTDVIENWVNDLPIDLNATEDKGFKDIMVKDLMEDIIDRQKYLQLNPGAKTSDLEELDHLKYHVFRWLNKLLDVNDLTNIMPKTELLMDNIKNISVPQIVRNKHSVKRRDNKKSQGGIPNYLGALQDEIYFWMNEMPSLNSRKDSSLNEQMIEELAVKIQQLQNNGQDIDGEIKKWLHQVTKDSDQNNLNEIAKAFKDRLIFKGFKGEVSWMQTPDSSRFIEENLSGGIMDWVKDLPLYLRRTPQEKHVQEEIVSDLARELKRVFETALVMPPEVDTDILFIAEIIKHLKRFPMDIQQKTDDEFINRTAQQLLHFIKGLQMFQNISDRGSRPPDEYFDANIEDWFSNLPIIGRKNSIDKRQFYNLKIELKTRLKQLRQRNANHQVLIEEITKYLRMFPITLDKRNDEDFFIDKAELLLKSLLAVPIGGNERIHHRDFEDQIFSVESLLGPKQGFKKAADILYENIKTWCEGLPIQGGETLGEKERIRAVKQNIATKLINKIGEMNLNPEVFNDDVLYEDLLQDEVDNLLKVLATNSKLEKSYEEHKKTLFNNIKEVKEKTRNELAGQMYKQQIRETIPKALPSHGTLSEEEQAYFNILKDNVADAFVNLIFFGASEELRNKFKNQINQEIIKFSNNYLKKYPASPVDSVKLNQDLFNALKRITVPTEEESLRNEVEETRMKDEIIDWSKDLPIKEQTGTEQLHTQKIMSILAKRLHDLEKDKELYSDFDDKLKTEIAKWVKKLPLNPEANNKIDEFAKKLVNILKSTEQSRRFSSSAIHSIDDLAEDSYVCSNHQTMIGKQKKPQSPADCNDSCMSQYIPPFSPSTLNTEDRAHLQRIRDRTLMPTRFKTCSPVLKDVSVNPAPIDTGSQTEIRPWGSSRPICSGMLQQISSMQTSQGVDTRPEVSPCLKTPISLCQADGVPQTASGSEHRQPIYPVESQASTQCAQRSQYEISPQVIVKEYRWESTRQNSGYQLSPQPCPEPSQYSRPRYSPSFTRKPSPCTNVPSGQSHMATPPPCITPQGSIPHAQFMPSQQNKNEDLYVTSRRARTRFEEQSFQPFCGQENEVGTSRSFRTPRVTRLGSLDDVQEAKDRRPRRPDRPDDFGWSSVQFPDDADFWETPCSRRHVIPSDDEVQEPFTRERERKEKKVRCRCREHVLTKCGGRRRCPSCQTNEESLKRCSKCCGAPCPYPTPLYFRQ